MEAYTRVNPVSQEVRLTNVPIPEIEPEEVLVQVEAFGVGIHDRYFIPNSAHFPYTIGTEGAGVIIKLGSKVTDFEIDDRVIFTSVLQPQGGTWAAYAAVKQMTLIPLSDDLTFTTGAAIPIAGGTALECMRELNLDKGDALFIAGASGAIGTFVIQLAAAKGILVSGSASEKNHAYMKTLGAEKAVDYHDPHWQSQVKAWAAGGVTAALAIQPGTGTDSIEVVKEGGILITVSGDNDQVVSVRDITVRQMQHTDIRQEMVQLMNSIANGEIEIVIEKEYAFEQALEALRKTETRHARGKLIVKGM